MSSSMSRLVERRGAAAILLALLLLAVVVVVFTGTLSRATELDQEAQRMAASLETLRDAVAARDRELQFVESDEFLQQQARAIGMGEPGEHAFSLPLDAPSPAPLVSLGDASEPHDGRAPFDDWMALLFGA
jgi:hypothetical protein